MNRNLNRRIHPIAEADGLSPKKLRKKFFFISHCLKNMVLVMATKKKGKGKGKGKC